MSGVGKIKISHIFLFLNPHILPDSKMEVSIILPTYQEAENLPRIIPRILHTLSQSKIQAEVIVVDDDSPDGASEVACKLAEQYPVRVLVRTRERGLATAVMAGFKMAESKVCVVMDADGSHPVEKLPQMIIPILEDRADITVGSRYIAGGSPGDWPWYRILISKFAALLARGLTRLSDPTSGYMGIKKELLAKLDLNPIGWKIVLETVCKSPSARLVEIPIVFSDRELGKSKLGLREQWHYICHLYRLYKYILLKK
jgi:dolichol-phosphate mannosyltransferase